LNPPITYTPEYEAAFQEWRSKRKPWQAMLAGIRSDKPADELRTLAAEAGASSDELRELARLHRSASQNAAEAKKLPAAQKQLDRIDADLAAARTAAESAGTAADRAEAAERAVLLEAQRVDFHRKEVAGPEAAGRIIETARAAGVL
jgi:ATPase subunit of ABC transporter with duplicated ATPase domains